MRSRVKKEKQKKFYRSFLTEGCIFDRYDIPYCQSTLTENPKYIVQYNRIHEVSDEKAKDTLVAFFIDDISFDGPINGVWADPQKAYQKLKRFCGVATPDFSTYFDFPLTEKMHNTYRTRALGFWWGKQGLSIINTVRWGGSNTWGFMFNGIPQKSSVIISTHGCLVDKENRLIYQKGLAHLVHAIEPCKILVYGSTPSWLFSEYQNSGIKILGFPSEISQYFSRRGSQNVKA